jgi:hypothetical protein
VAPDGVPEARTIVLRGFDPARRRLLVHTDIRSRKLIALRKQPRVALVAWDARAQLQLRLSGTMGVARPEFDAGARAAWDALPAVTRLLYAGRDNPGAPVASPPPPAADATGAETNFALLAMEFTRLDWLSLDAAGHRRACFTWETSGAPAGQWLAP